jgi:hypothetical protein
MRPIHPENGPRELRKAGIVLGPFRRPRPHGHEERLPSCRFQGDRLLKKKKELFPGHGDIQTVQEIEFFVKK